MKPCLCAKANLRPSIRLFAITTLIATLFVSGCSEYLPLSSGALEGVVTATPSRWDQVAATEIIQLETSNEAPYSVNLWVVELDGDLHIFAGDNRATWVENIEHNAAVRLRAGELIYELQASRVTDAAKFELFAQAWESKYGNRPRNENVGETYLFMLQPRRAPSQ